ncbi:hypothetical protein [Dokdonella sp.]|uniref:hypothetical protein n=1 Tax=Dokdonella sp. TaxID=2291710 RepID=UPI0037836D9A
MGIFSKVLIAVLTVATTPAWAFCDNDGSSGGSNCHQLDSVGVLTYNGPMTTHYADARGDAIMGSVPTAFSFYLDLSQLAQPQGSSETVFAEMLIGNSAGQARTLVLKFRNDGGAYALVQEWWQARPYWSTADDFGDTSARTLQSTWTCPLSNLGDIPVQIDPVNHAWDTFNVNVSTNGCRTNTYGMPPLHPNTPYSLLRLRTGIIHSSSLWRGMAVGFDFVFPGTTS